MRVQSSRGKPAYTVNLGKPIDVSIPLRGSSQNPRAWYLSPPEFQVVKTPNWIGSVNQGGSVNFNTLTFNPHAHGTHTECVGHISDTVYSVNAALHNFFFWVEVISVLPVPQGTDKIITQALLKKRKYTTEAIAIRTLPNTEAKLTKNYDHTNWPYLEEAAALWLRQSGVKHLLIDTPSVDKEKDEGLLLAHKAFWNVSAAPDTNATITEFIFIPDYVVDGLYFLSLQVPPFENDAAPSRPVLYPVEKCM